MLVVEELPRLRVEARWIAFVKSTTLRVNGVPMDCRRCACYTIQRLTMKTPLIIFASVTLLCGCAHVETGDPLMAERVLDLGVRTREVVAQGNAGRLSLAESRRFLRKSQGEVRSLGQRVELSHLNAQEVDILNWLDGEYDTLLKSRRPLRSQSALKLQNTLYALRTLRPVNNLVLPEVVAGAATASTDDIDTSTNTDTSRKDCDKGHDHGGHDHGKGDCGCDHGHK
jgi:hypothetical protein